MDGIALSLLDGVDVLRRRPCFYEFFCGGGLVRLGLGEGWECVGAIDNDPHKIAAYRANFGDSDLVADDIRNLKSAAVPGTLDLAWASFPCTNVSVAGKKDGLDAEFSGAFWPFWKIVLDLVRTGRAPSVIALENVRGLLTTGGGRDIAAIVGAMVAAGYRVGAILVDACQFLPHSRKRIFIVGVMEGVPLPFGLVTDAPSAPYHTADIVKVVNALPPRSRESWVWWHLPKPGPMTDRLEDLLDPDGPETAWHAAAQTDELVASKGPGDLVRLAAAQASGKREVGTIYVRTRSDVMGRRRMANNRFDGVATCLVTPNGRGSSQIVLVVEGASVRTRYMEKAEAARLMGIPASYKLPRGYNAAFGIFGDGVAVPVVRHLAQHLLEPLVGAAASWRPRTETESSTVSFEAEIQPVGTAAGTARKSRSGIKGATIGTTVYLKPAESKRVKRLALELDVSMHDLLLQGLDRLLAEAGQRPIERYERVLRRDVRSDGGGRKRS